MTADKRSIRRSVFERAKSLSSDESDRRSRKILELLTQLPEWARADAVLCYLPLPGEVDTEPLAAAALASGKPVALPRMEGEHIVFHRIEHLLHPWVLHPWGVREPSPELPLLDPSAYSSLLALVPGVAFDRNCRRLGRGGGFYDRFLAKEGGALTAAGLCFSFQVLRELPVEPHDIEVDLVVTDGEVIRPPKAARRTAPA